MSTNILSAFNAEAAARHLGIAASTRAKLRSSGDGPNFCKIGRRVVYRVDDLNSWLDSKVRRSTSDPSAVEVKMTEGVGSG